MRYRQVFNNVKWIVAGRIVQSILQLIVGMLCARYLGPSNYGLINYATSITAFALPLMKLGFDATLVHELVESPSREEEIIGTSIIMNLISSIVCIGLVTSFASIVNAGERTTILVCVLYSFSLFFAAIEMIQYWFQYKLQSKYQSIVMLFSYILVSIYKIYLLISGKSIFWFAVTNSLDYGIIGISLVIIYLRKTANRFTFSFTLAKQMFKRSKHYIFASLMVVMFQSTDHIMLTSMIGKVENGYYSAAITSAGVTQFVYMAIIDSFRPIILSSKKEGSAEFGHHISRLYCIITYLSIAQSIAFTLFAGLIIRILYGASYIPSVSVLKILVWYLAFSYMGAIRNIWILAEQKQKLLWKINLFGAIANIIMNAILIPFWGACGAAFASFLTQFFTNFVLGFILKPIRENNRLLLIGINPKFAISEFKNILQLLKRKKSV